MHGGEDPMAMAALFREEAAALGFVRVGFAKVAPIARYPLYQAWLERGFGADLRYLEAGQESRRDPGALFRAARTVVTVALPYGGGDEEPAAPIAAERLGRGPTGRIARYARGGDYHVVFKEKLRQLAAAISGRLGRAIAHLACVDTAPLLERELASAGGLGFQAKNTLLIAPGAGSYLLLGELLTDVVCAPAALDAATPRCGACTLCLDACPTGAFVGPYLLDARRCISYLTIENTGAIPRALRPLIGDHIFGCDVCQEVCPFNAADHGPPAPALSPRPGYSRPHLVALLGLGAARFRKWQAKSALRRIHRAELLRNVAVALGNVGGVAELPPLMQALGEPSPLVRAHVAWAIGAIVRRSPAPPSGTAALLALLGAALAREKDEAAAAELASALTALDPRS